MEENYGYSKRVSLRRGQRRSEDKLGEMEKGLSIKKEGWSWVKDVRAANLSLLSKWGWRLLHNDRPLLKEVLFAKYGDHIGSLMDLGSVRCPTYSLKWWKDIASLEEPAGTNWFIWEIVRKVGNGTSFG